MIINGTGSKLGSFQTAAAKALLLLQGAQPPSHSDPLQHHGYPLSSTARQTPTRFTQVASQLLGRLKNSFFQAPQKLLYALNLRSRPAHSGRIHDLLSIQPINQASKLLDRLPLLSVEGGAKAWADSIPVPGKNVHDQQNKVESQLATPINLTSPRLLAEHLRKWQGHRPHLPLGTSFLFSWLCSDWMPNQRQLGLCAAQEAENLLPNSLPMRCRSPGSGNSWAS